MSKPYKEQFSGSLIGQCLGDALGFVVEGYPAKVCNDYVEEILRTDLIGTYGRGNFPFGQYTDDSQLARELLESYVKCKDFNPINYAKHIENIFKEKRIVGYGGATKQAANRLIKGISWNEAGTPSPSAGNGSAMRAAPVGLIYWFDSKKLIQTSINQGIITHKDTRCSAGAITIAGAVALVLEADEINKEDFLLRLIEWTKDIDNIMPFALEHLLKWHNLEPEEVIRLIGENRIEPNYNRHKGISGFVISSVLWSIYSFLHTPRDYFESICTAIRVGGDVDTTAAMTGAISGAYLGLEKLPLEIAKKINDKGTWDFNSLIELAYNTYEIQKTIK